MTWIDPYPEAARLRILILSQFCTPEPNFKGLSLAKELAQRGHEAKILTGLPNYPGGRIYPGYRVRLWQREVIEGIPVLRVPLYPSHDRSAIRRVANYTSFAFFASTIGVTLIGDADITYVYHPPGTIGLPACVLRLLRGIPFVYDIQDLWPEAVAHSGMLSNRFAMSVIDYMSRIIYRQASHITVLSPGFKKALVKRGVPEEKVSVIYNWCDDEIFKPVSRDQELARREGMDGKFSVIYAGNMGVGQGISEVLDAAELLLDMPEIQFVMFGDGTEVSRLERQTERRGLKNVAFKGRRPMIEMPALLALGDVALVHLRENPLFQMWIPSKTQAYMACGLPIIINVPGEASDLVAKAQAGVAVPPGDPKALANAIRALYQMPQDEREAMGSRGSEYYTRHLSCSVGVDQFLELFNKVVNDGKKRVSAKRQRASVEGKKNGWPPL